MRHSYRLPTALALAALALLVPLTAHADLTAKFGDSAQHGSVLAYLLAYALGVGTSLTPCVYPLIPITLSIFGARGESVSRARALLLASAYVGGMCTMYTSLGLFFGKAFGTWLASPYVIWPIATLFLVMAASMFGAFEMNLPPAIADRLSRVGGSGFTGAFVMGLVAGIIAAPCTGPALVLMLGIAAAKGSTLFGGSLLFVYAFGIGLLFFVLAAGASSLPRSGAWMLWVKSVFGIVMVVAALYFLRNVVPPLAHFGSWKPTYGAIMGSLAVAGIVLGAVHLDFHTGGLEAARKGVAVLFAVVGIFGVISYAQTGKPLDWAKGEAAALSLSASTHKPVLFDFSADWCGPCKEMEVKVFGNNDVQKELARFVVGKIDCTEDDDAVAAVKDKYGAKTLPSVVVLGSDGKIAQTWNKEITAEELLEGIRAVQ